MGSSPVDLSSVAAASSAPRSRRRSMSTQSSPGSTADTYAPLLGEQLVDCVNRLSRSVQDRLGPQGLSIARLRVLEVLIGRGQIRQSALSKERGLAPRTVTELVNLLERDGLVRREPDPTNRAAFLLHVTDAGRAAQAAGQSACADAWSAVFATLSPAERQRLGRILERLDEGDADAADMDRPAFEVTVANQPGTIAAATSGNRRRGQQSAS